jgi:small subunit ribosomal protein S17
MRTKKGIVTSAKMQKTVTVAVTRFVMHPKYQKRYPVRKKFLADTSGLDLKEGDLVLIGETRPLSKRKHFKVLEVLGRAEVRGVSLEEELRNLIPAPSTITSQQSTSDNQQSTITISDF